MRGDRACPCPPPPGARPRPRSSLHRRGRGRLFRAAQQRPTRPRDHRTRRRGAKRPRAERFIAARRRTADEGTGALLAMDRDPMWHRSFGGVRPGGTRIHRSASSGLILPRAHAARRYGDATEGARASPEAAFDTLDLNRVQAETDTRNVASARVLEKLGFVREGTLREDCVVNGEVSDSWVYGLDQAGVAAMVRAGSRPLRLVRWAVGPCRPRFGRCGRSGSRVPVARRGSHFRGAARQRGRSGNQRQRGLCGSCC